MKLNNQIAKARIDSVELEKYAKDLLSSATSSEKRADIYLLVTIRSIEISLRRTRNLVHKYAMVFAMFILMFIIVVTSKFLYFDYMSPSMIITYVGIFASLASWSVYLWFSWLLEKFESSWETGVANAMHTKLEKHDTKS